jgi:NDP-sugar pyrophosphorylase family protein
MQRHNITTAVILAGGRGVRLRPLTDTVPKPMVEICGRPFLLYQINLLKRGGISEFIICAGYLKEKIMGYFGDGSRMSVKISYSVENDFLGTGGALKNAQEMLPERFLVLNGDSYLPMDYAGLLEFSAGSSCAGVVVCYNNADRMAPNNIYLDAAGVILKYDKSCADSRLNFVDAGVSVFKKEALGYIPERRSFSLEKELFPCLIENKQLIGYAVTQRFYDIGTPEGLRQIEEALK